jgi:hypothetical protein
VAELSPFGFNKKVMIAIAIQRIAKNIAPAIKVPVRSTKIPIIDGNHGSPDSEKDYCDQ